MKSSVKILAAAGLVLLVVGVEASHKQLEFDQLVTPDAIFGGGNVNGSFTVNRNDGVEVGLRVKQRFPAPANVFNSNGDGTYSFAAGSACPGFLFVPAPLCLATPVWNFEWSINTDYDGSSGLKLDDLRYELGMDADPRRGTDFTVFNPIAPSLIAPAWDHALGTNATPNGGGVKFPNPVTYPGALAAHNVAQNSWNYEFFNNPGTSLASFNPSVPGNYAIYLRAIDPARNRVIAQTVIQVLVGGAKAVRGRIVLPGVGGDSEDDN